MLPPYPVSTHSYCYPSCPFSAFIPSSSSFLAILFHSILVVGILLFSPLPSSPSFFPGKLYIPSCPSPFSRPVFCPSLLSIIFPYRFILVRILAPSILPPFLPSPLPVPLPTSPLSNHTFKYPSCMPSPPPPCLMPNFPSSFPI